MTKCHRKHTFVKMCSTGWDTQSHPCCHCLHISSSALSCQRNRQNEKKCFRTCWLPCKGKWEAESHMESLSIYSALSYRNVSAAKTMTRSSTRYYICVRNKYCYKHGNNINWWLKNPGAWMDGFTVKDYCCSYRVSGLDSQASIECTDMQTKCPYTKIHNC